MRHRVLALLLIGQTFCTAVIIDRIAIVVGNSIVKDSDIIRDIRVTEFLNGDTPSFTAASRKKAADRLIDQLLIRREINVADYPRATAAEARDQLQALEKQRFNSSAELQNAMEKDGITQPELVSQFQWQLTVLRFIDARFKPAVFISDEEADKYYRDHAAALHREYPGKSLEQLRQPIRNILSGERVNQQFFAWLDEQRKDAKVQYLEEGLR